MQRAAASLASSRSAAAWACSTTSRHAGASCSAAARRDAAVPLLIRGRQHVPLHPLSMSLISRRQPARTAAAAAAAELTPVDEVAVGGGIAGTVQLGAMIVAWYLLNIYFNIYNKLVSPNQHLFPLSSVIRITHTNRFLIILIQSSFACDR